MKSVSFSDILPGMVFEELPLQDIQFKDETYRIHEMLDSECLLQSLREVGQLNPVVLQAMASGYRIVSGFRRVRGLLQLGKDRVLARCIAEDGCTSLQLFRIAFWESVAQHDLNALESARVLSVLKNVCSVPHDTLVDVYLPALGLKPHKNVLRSYLRLNDLPPDLRTMLLQGLFTLSSAERIADTPRETQTGIAELFRKARFSSSLQREVLDLLEELSASESLTIGEVVSRQAAREILEDDARSPFQKGEDFRAFLYRWRYPRLSRARDEFRESKAKLGLPGAVRVTPDPFFETSRIHVEFEVSTARDFRDISAALHNASGAALETLFCIH